MLVCAEVLVAIFTHDAPVPLVPMSAELVQPYPAILTPTVGTPVKAAQNSNGKDQWPPLRESMFPQPVVMVKVCGWAFKPRWALRVMALEPPSE